MKLRPLFRRITFWPLLLALTSPLIAQRPSPDGSDRHPSDLRYPLNTWMQRELIRYSFPLPRPLVYRAGSMSKLQSIVIPRIEFRGTTLRDAVEYLHQESRRLDPDPNPDTRGVNIALRLPEPPAVGNATVESWLGLPFSATTAQASTTPETRITLTMERLPLLEALRYVASQAGLTVAFQPDAVAIVPLNSVAIPTLTTANYRVPPELLGLPADIGKRIPKGDPSFPSVTIQQMDMIPWFESKGVEFPPGAMATYLPARGKLIVRNTRENLDKIVSVVSSSLKPIVPPSETP